MRRGRIFIFVALILIIGLAVVALVFRQVISPGQQAATVQPTTVTIWIAGQYIPQGEEIVGEALTTMEIPQDNVVSVMYTLDKKDELVGKTAKYPLDQGVVITSSMVSEGPVASDGPVWAAKIPPGMVAIAMPTNRLDSVAFGIRDGARVNVNACFLFVDVDPSFQTKLPNDIKVLTAPATVEPPAMPGVTMGIYPVDSPQPQGRTEVESAFQQGMYVVPSSADEGGQRPRLVCQTVVQNALVLKFGTFPLTEPKQPAADEAADPQAQQAQPAQEIPDVVTLIVPPQEATTLSYLTYSNAKVTMTLKNVLDDSRIQTEAATLQFLLSQYNIPVPAKLPYALEPTVSELVSPTLPNDAATVPPAE